jgi:TolB-like protein/class 3 adenylate cyclase
MPLVFGDYALDVDRRELSRVGEPVALAPQVFDLLVYLVRNRDRVVSKDDLIEAVWGGRIVSESALTTRLNAVRTAIGDSGAEQRLIRTISRRGVRFVGEVRDESAPPPRRLAAILAADVAGYSRLMGADEEGTLERLKTLRRELIDPTIAGHHGRIVKTTGDGLLTEFASIVDAVRCAAEVQSGMLDREPEMAEEQRIRLRIGINLGDVIVEGEDIFGDGVNVAARLEGLAAPGGICVSGTVRDHVGDRVPCVFEDKGEQTVKNIARPVRVYALHLEPNAAPRSTGVPIAVSRRGRTAPAATAAAVVAMLLVAAGGWWFWPATKPAPPAAVAAATSIAQPLVAPRLSIVVLPFANLGNDPDQQYFADGITEDLTTDLSRIPGMFVISRNSAFTYRNKPVETRQIARELGVRYVLEGSVQRSGNQVRVNAQLIDAETGAHLWAERFDRDIGDLFTLQSEITSRIANALNLELMRAEAARPTDNPNAMDHIFKGRAALAKGNPRESAAEAIGLFERALALDPRSVEAQSRLALALVLHGQEGGAAPDDGRADFKRAEALIEQALVSSPEYPVAHIARADLLANQRRCEDAIPEYEKVLGSRYIATRAWLAVSATASS